MRNFGWLLVASLLVAGCGAASGGTVNSTEVVCDEFAGFARDGSPAGKRAEVVRSIGQVVGNADQRIQDAHRTLVATVDGTPGARKTADDTFAQACFDSGWQS